MQIKYCFPLPIFLLFLFERQRERESSIGWFTFQVLGIIRYGAEQRWGLGTQTVSTLQRAVAKCLHRCLLFPRAHIIRKLMSVIELGSTQNSYMECACPVQYFSCHPNIHPSSNTHLWINTCPCVVFLSDQSFNNAVAWHLSVALNRCLPSDYVNECHIYCYEGYTAGEKSETGVTASPRSSFSWHLKQA